MTRLPTVLALAAGLAAVAAPAMAGPDPAFGEWLTDDGMAKVAIAPCSYEPAKACGAITWLKDPVGHPSRDIHNPDRALRGRPLVGVLVIRDMTPKGPGQWDGGRVYDPETGRAARGGLRALSRNRLRVDGCLLVVCEDQTWTRADGAGS